MEHGGKWLERSVRRRVAVIVVFSLILGMLPVGEASVSRAAEGQSRSSSLRNPRVSDGVTTWDCIYFGRYWQNDTNGDGKADQDDDKEPIKWRVLSVDGDDAFLVADRNLDCQQYNNTDGEVTWEISTLRDWINTSFLNNAFSASEQSAIKSTQVINNDNPDFGTEGGNNTIDKVYLLSSEEVTNEDYGFSTSSNENAVSRRALNTDYVKGQGALTSSKVEYEGNGYWWLRSPGHKNTVALHVNEYGNMSGVGSFVNYNNRVVRPALHLDLSSVSEWSLAGTVASDGTVTKPSVRPTESPKVTPLPSTNPPYADLQNPRVSDGVTTWDCIYFGNYWQNDTNGDGTADQDDDKEPIKWRVLSVDGDDAFLVADRNLDCQEYNDTPADVTWETSTLREWLNDSFFNNAFSASEQSAIKNTRVINNDNPDYGTEGGGDTTDQVYLLSIDEVTNGDYGFSISSSESAKNRRALNTAYAKEQGAYTSTDTEYEGNGYWWLRSPGHYSYNAAYVRSSGDVRRGGDDVNYDGVGVRPALHLNLSSVSEWSPAGTVVSDEVVIEPTPTIKATPNVTKTPSPTPKVTIIPSVKPTQIPTHKPEIDETSTPTSKPEATVSATPTKVPTTKPEVDETPTPTSKPEASAPAITTAAPGADVTPTPTIRPGLDITPTPKPGTSQTQPQVSTKPSEKPSSGSDGTVIPPNPDIPSAINPDIISKNDDSGGEKQSLSKREVTPGKIVTVFGLQYKIKKSTQKERTVVLWKASNKKIKKATIPNSIKIQSASYKVVEISKNAFKGCKQLQTATIGKEVRIIGNGAFSGCRKIKKVIIRSKVLKKIGKGAFAGVSRKAKIQVPKSKVAQYRKLMKKG